MLAVTIAATAADAASELERYGRILAHSSAGNQLEYRGIQGRWRSYRLRFVLRTTPPAEAQRIARRWQAQFCSPELRQLLSGLKVRRVSGSLEGAASTAVVAECGDARSVPPALQSGARGSRLTAVDALSRGL